MVDVLLFFHISADFRFLNVGRKLSYLSIKLTIFALRYEMKICFTFPWRQLQGYFDSAVSLLVKGEKCGSFSKSSRFLVLLLPFADFDILYVRDFRHKISGNREKR